MMGRIPVRDFTGTVADLVPERVGVSASQRDELWSEASEAASDTSPGQVVDEE